MQKTITYCDIYKTEEAENFQVHNGFLNNGGPDKDVDWYTIDLGHKAAMNVLKYLQDRVLTQVQREALISYFKTLRKT